MVNEQVSDTDDELPPVAPREVERTKEVTLKSKSVVSGPSRASNSGGQGSLFSFFKKQ